MFSLMSHWKDDKDGLVFEETSRMLRHATLKQKSNQETRWARADIESKRNFFRNAVTIFICFGRKVEMYAREINLTKQKEIESLMKPLQNFEFWVYLVGYTQILNIVVEASLEAQYSSRFASSCLFLVTQAFKKIRQLGD